MVLAWLGLVKPLPMMRMYGPILSMPCPTKRHFSSASQALRHIGTSVKSSGIRVSKRLRPTIFIYSHPNLLLFLLEQL